MKNKIYLLLLPLLLLTGCQSINESISKIQSQLGIPSNIKEFKGVKFEAKSCELTKMRIITCKLVVTSKYQDRVLNTLGGGGYTVVQDDTGKSYSTRMSFGESAEGGQKQSVLIADTPYNITLIAENISSQATKVRAINIKRMDLSSAETPGQYGSNIKLVLNNPPVASTLNTSAQLTPPVVSKASSTGATASVASRSVKTFRGVEFEAQSCELNKMRTITCKLVVTSKYQDRVLNTHGGGSYTKVQDDTGKSYSTRMSFGESAEGGQNQSVLIADTPYNITLIAENISSQATKVRAIDIKRMDLSSAETPGRYVSNVILILAHPPMIAPQNSNSTPTTKTSTALNTSKSVIAGTAAMGSIAQTTKPKTSTPRRSTSSGKSGLPGCWNWSNGANIVINTDGSAYNGPFAASWKTVDSTRGRYTIAWPSFVDTLTLSADGSALTGKNNYNLPVTATRKSGKVSSAVGNWLWSNGVTVTIHSNASVTAGALKGIWTKSGNKWIIEWPLVDTVSLSKDGRSLSAKNQFGAVTASRKANCKENG